MDLRSLVMIGDKSSCEYIVTIPDTAHYIGNTGITVLSTPAMIKYMEKTASMIIVPKLPEKYNPVGTKINIQHIRSTAVNEKITVNATLLSLDERKLVYYVEAYNEKELIGFGEYEQYVINKDHFINK